MELIFLLSFLLLLCVSGSCLIFIFLYFVSEGHGGSDGVHGYVSSLDHAVGDLVLFRTYRIVHRYKFQVAVFFLAVFSQSIFEVPSCAERISGGCCIGGKPWFAVLLIWALHRWSYCFEGKAIMFDLIDLFSKTVSHISRIGISIIFPFCMNVQRPRWILL